MLGIVRAICVWQDTLGEGGRPGAWIVSLDTLDTNVRFGQMDETTLSIHNTEQEATDEALRQGEERKKHVFLIDEDGVAEFLQPAPV